MMQDNSISLNKFISSTGICSRREADKWIEAGRVKINGQVARKGNRVEDGDTVTIDDKPLKVKPKAIYLAFNKPPGVTCTTDQRDPSNIIDFINYSERIFPIGRLDKPSTGLILLTNDGDIVNKILRVENNHEKEYIVKVDRPVNQRFIQKMSDGIPILGTMTKKCQVEPTTRFVFRIILTQGLNRQIRRMCEYLGYKVVSLKRIRVMSIGLGDLKQGQWRELTATEVESLMGQL
jgi:23S rRNA pseudouridine2604 synthase